MQASSTRFCAFCRSERTVYLKRRSSLVDVGWAAAAACALSFLIWQDLDPRAIGFFAVGLGVAELFVQIRWRMSLPCPHCGFDPALYKRDQPAAAARVKRRLDERREDPTTWLAPMPKLPIVIKKKAAPTAERLGEIRAEARAGAELADRRGSRAVPAPERAPRL